MGNDRKKVRVAAAVIRKGELVFATQRGYGAYKDWWEFPGGKIEEGETPEEALIREIREELDADITVDEYITTVEYDYPDFHLSMSCYRCSLKNEHMTLLEHEAAKWMRADNLRQVNWLPADIVIVNILEAENRTLKYYENNADSFVQDTVSADMSGARQRFMEYLPRQARILDFGCGSGRDIKFFLDKGYIVDGADGSPELCRIASDYTGIGVKQMRFQELDAEELYDGIWACASILHLLHNLSAIHLNCSILPAAKASFEAPLIPLPHEQLPANHHRSAHRKQSSLPYSAPDLPRHSPVRFRCFAAGFHRRFLSAEKPVGWNPSLVPVVQPVYSAIVPLLFRDGHPV